MKITGRHMEVTTALKRHIRSRFERLDRYDVPILRLEIILSVSKLQHTAEAVCLVGGKRFQARVSTREMYATIDQLVGRLDAQIRKFKEQRVEHKRKKGKGPAPSAVDVAPSDRGTLKVVRPQLAVLSRSEARSQLGPRPGAMVLFTCSESGRLQIMQRSDAGQILLIDP